MRSIRLSKASQLDADKSYLRFMNFLDAHPNPFISPRPEDLIRSAINDESLFFVQNESGQIIATTGFYRHGAEEDLWGEIGSTLVDEEYRGMGLQVEMYHQIICLQYLSDWPKHTIAVVADCNIGSCKNIERCGFDATNSVPDSLARATPTRKWNLVTGGEKRLYILSDDGVAKSLLHVAETGNETFLSNKRGAERVRLFVDFSYLKQVDAATALRAEASELVKRFP